MRVSAAASSPVEVSLGLVKRNWTHLVGHLQPTHFFFQPGDGGTLGLRPRSLGWWSLRLGLQFQRGCWKKRAAVVPNPVKALEA